MQVADLRIFLQARGVSWSFHRKYRIERLCKLFDTYKNTNKNVDLSRRTIKNSNTTLVLLEIKNMKNKSKNLRMYSYRKLRRHDVSVQIVSLHGMNGVFELQLR